MFGEPGVDLWGFKCEDLCFWRSGLGPCIGVLGFVFGSGFWVLGFVFGVEGLGLRGFGEAGFEG